VSGQEVLERRALEPIETTDSERCAQGGLLGQRRPADAPSASPPGNARATRAKPAAGTNTGRCTPRSSSNVPRSADMTWEARPQRQNGALDALSVGSALVV
jgi:hypothetical protein